MKKKFLRSVFYNLLILLIISRGLIAGAWTQEKGGYYLKLGGSFFSTKNEFDFTGTKRPIFDERIAFENASFQDINFTAYMEYGITNRLTLVANLPFKALRSEWDEVTSYNNNHILSNTNGFGDLSFSARYGVWTKPFILSVQGGIKLPLGYDKKPENRGSPLGSGEVDTEGLVLVGRGFHPLPIYVTGGVGYRQRGGVLNDEMLYTSEVGYFFGNFIFKVTFDGVINTSTPPDLYGSTVITPLPGGGGALPSTVPNDQDITKVSPSLIYSLKENLAIQLDILDIIAGKNTVSGIAFSVGIVFTR